ncbi:hypothetical protein BC832DRAFT_622410 [Gaertneriomyces semiglobifer]|nr:hypothetical protein BC832DRAFT_622410 [Gaertneriomyces semiglobifer]
METETEQKVGFWSRVVQNNLYVRLALSAMRTTRNVARSPFFLAPDGLNNPFDLPNVRYRDGLLLAVGGADPLQLLGLDNFLEEAMNGLLELFGIAGSAGGKWALNFVTNEVIDSLINEPLLNLVIPFRPTDVTLPTVISKEVVAKHKICNFTAKLQYYYGPHSTKESGFTWDYFKEAKAWYCRYLYATHRNPKGIPRRRNPTIIESTGKFLYCDYFTAYEILNLSSGIIPMCEADPQCDLPVRRLVVSVVGISPFRGLWAQSRRPDQAILTYKMLNGCPSLVIPVGNSAPVLAWDTKPLKELWKLTGKELEDHANNLCAYLYQMIDYEHVVLPRDMGQKIRPHLFLKHAVWTILQVAVSAKHWSFKNSTLNSNEAGVVFLRYHQASAILEADDLKALATPAKYLKHSQSEPALRAKADDQWPNLPDDELGYFDIGTPAFKDPTMKGSLPPPSVVTDFSAQGGRAPFGPGMEQPQYPRYPQYGPAVPTFDDPFARQNDYRLPDMRHQGYPDMPTPTLNDFPVHSYQLPVPPDLPARAQFPSTVPPELPARAQFPLSVVPDLPTPPGETPFGGPTTEQQPKYPYRYPSSDPYPSPGLYPNNEPAPQAYPEIYNFPKQQSAAGHRAQARWPR